MNNLATAEPKRVDEMIAMWELWATKNQVAYPECFNMYEFLKAKKEKQEKTKNNDETKSE
jgi:arylsulfatase